MKVIAYSVRPDEEKSFKKHSDAMGVEMTIVHDMLTPDNAALVKGHDAVTFLGNDIVNEETLKIIKQQGVTYLSSRAAGTNNIDIDSAKQLGLKVANVARYSPYAIAEFTLTLAFTMLRNLPRALKRIQAQNYSLAGLIGEEMRFQTVGVIGTGRIGLTTAQIFSGVCKRVIAHDIYENPEAKDFLEYVEFDELLKEADIIALHCPYTKENHHLINAEKLALMKQDALLVNTARGELVDTSALIDVLKTGKIKGYAGDVYEKEVGIVHRDHTNSIIPDPMFLGLINMPNVLFTPHYAFYTDVAVDNMVEYALQNLRQFYNGEPCDNEIV
ncbi:NAD(P)-dependent oxidoreductase [Psychrobacter lutiphocae]|uniref:NAD(P)-dependent oxidoreductase n=1 Tax=Psychrobacter lutiphocae TaxID=540500 RepID=UPI00036CAA42|nr:NAD(P)-dependent oxidoreductase [Psychrobacter lutiphocae]